MYLPNVELAQVHLPHGFRFSKQELEEKQKALAAFVTQLFSDPSSACTDPSGSHTKGTTLHIYGRWHADDSPNAGPCSASAPAIELVNALPAPSSSQSSNETGDLPECDCFLPPVIFDEDDPTPLDYPKRFQIELGASKIHGRGVFARKRFVAKEVVEVCPVLEIHSRNVGGILEDYVFCADQKGWRCLVLGCGMMYNSWMQANVCYYRDEAGNFVYVASRDIEKGEELLIDYGNDWWETRKKESVEESVLHWTRSAGKANGGENKKPKTSAGRSSKNHSSRPKTGKRKPSPRQARKPRKQLETLERNVDSQNVSGGK